jgi:hypothetical protein
MIVGIILISVGVPYTFFGGKVFRYLYGLAWFGFTFGLVSAILGMVNMWVGLIGGIAAGAFACHSCMHKEHLQGLVLGCQAGEALASFLFVVLF